MLDEVLMCSNSHTIVIITRKSAICDKTLIAKSRFAIISARAHEHIKSSPVNVRSRLITKYCNRLIQKLRPHCFLTSLLSIISTRKFGKKSSTTICGGTGKKMRMKTKRSVSDKSMMRRIITKISRDGE